MVRKILCHDFYVMVELNFSKSRCTELGYAMIGQKKAAWETFYIVLRRLSLLFLQVSYS